MRSIGKGIVGIIMLIYIGILYGSTTIILLGFIAAVFVVLSFAYMLYLSYCLTARVSVGVPVVDVGQKATVSISVDYRGLLPISKVRYRVGIRPSHQRKRVKGSWMYGSTVLPGHQEWTFEVEPDVAGGYEVQLQAVEFGDITGFFSWKKRYKQSVMLRAFPTLTDIGIRVTGAVRNFIGESEVYDDFRPGTDSTELYGVREFRAGDKMQSVHWKLSAKSDDLMVKEHSHPKACAVTILLQDQNIKKGKQSGAFLGMAGSLSYSLMDNGCCHYVCWYSAKAQDLVRIRVDDEESYYLFMNAYMDEDFRESRENVLERYKEKYRTESLVHLFVLTEELCLQEGDLRLLEAKSGNWKKLMGEMELQV